MGYKVIPGSSRVFRFPAHGFLVSALLATTSFHANAQNSPGASAAAVSTSQSGAPILRGATAGQVDGEIPPPNQFYGAVDLSETYTSNAVGLSGSGAAADDEYTRAALQLGLRYHSRRLNVTADYSLTGDYYARFHSLNEYFNNLNLFAASEIVQDHLFLNINAFATPMVLNRLGAISADGALGSPQNTTNSYGYQVQPEYMFRISDFVTSTTSVSEGTVAYASPSGSHSATNPFFDTPQGATSFDATEQIASGQYFGRFNWSLTGTYDKLDQTSETLTQSDGVAHLGYAVDRSFSLLASGGYTDYKSSTPLMENLSGPLALVGFSLTPSPSFQLTAQGGTRSNHPTYIGSLEWNVTPLTSIVGQLTDTVTTPQGNTLGNIGNSLANTGGFGSLSPNTNATTTFNQPSSLPSSGSSLPQQGLAQGLALDNSIYRDRQATLTFSHTAERTEYSLVFIGEMRDQLTFVVGQNTKSQLYGISANVNRQLRQNLTAYASVQYSYANEFNGHDKIYNASVGLYYSLSKTFSVYAIERYIRRDDNFAFSVGNIPLEDDEAGIGVKRTF